MKKAYRLRAAGDFALLFRYGTRIQSPLFQLLWHPNALSHARFAFVAPKSVARRAVARNLLRRRGREWIQKREDVVSRPIDASIIFKKGAPDASAQDLYEELHRAFKKISS